MQGIWNGKVNHQTQVFKSQKDESKKEGREETLSRGVEEDQRSYVCSSLDLLLFKITTHLSLGPNKAIAMHSLLGPHKPKGVALKKMAFNYQNFIIMFSYPMKGFFMREGMVFFYIIIWWENQD